MLVFMDKQFFYQMIIVISAIVASLVLIFMLHIWLIEIIDIQNNQNIYLKKQWIHIRSDLMNLESKKYQQKNLENHVRFLMKLQVKNFRAISLLDELSQTASQKILLNKIIRQNNMIKLEGMALHDSDFYDFVRYLKKSTVLFHPVLEAQDATHFRLKALQKE